MRFIFFTFFIFLLASCAEIDKETAPLVIKPASFSDLPGWASDNHKQALTAFTKSCARILKKDPAEKFGGTDIITNYGDWQPACRALDTVTNARIFFEQWFSPWQASFGGSENEGLFTGYYEPSLKGALKRHGPYQYPLHSRPDDLIMVDLGKFRDDLKGRRIAGRALNGQLKPYEDRARIIAGNWPHNDQVLAWVDDPVDAFFLHIQGSGRVIMDDGNNMRVGYAGQNGHVYYAIGRELIKRGHLEKDEVSLQSIRAWLEANPNKANEIMNTNESYVFFTKLEGEGPIGGENIPLTAGRSLAVDRTKIPYGTPIWVDISPPTENENTLRRLMVAQDTGGAIRGAVRGDVFWGHGDRAEYLAGHMKSKGKYWLLLPKKLTH